MNITQIGTDLVDEQQDLDDLISRVSPKQWLLPTPSAGWSVAHQIAHLTYFDRAASVAITDPPAFRVLVTELLEATAAGGDMDDLTLGEFLDLAPSGLLSAWRTARQTLADAVEHLAADTRVEWYGPSMSSKSFLTARLMETWAHGQDIADAIGDDRIPTDRLYHIARLGFLTRGWSFVNRGLAEPDSPLRLELEAPSGGQWTFGPEEANESIVGPAVDFCLVVTQRRHVDDTRLATTPDGRDWMLVAQCFAGPPTEGPDPGSTR